MVLKLSEFFRTSLAINPTQDVRLADEIELQELYLELERVRFPERLTYSVDVPPDLASARVPSLILQPLVENAVKHGVLRCEGGTHITIRARREAEMLHLSVSNDTRRRGDEPAGPGNGAGIGLDNVRNRLIARYDGDFTMSVLPQSPNGFTVEISFPLKSSVAAPFVSPAMPLVS